MVCSMLFAAVFALVAAGALGGTCRVGADVQCPGSGNRCAGDQCCPGYAGSGGATFPCPSASAGFSGCVNSTKISSCLSSSLRGSLAQPKVQAQHPNLSLPSCGAPQRGQGIDMDAVCQRQHGCAQSDCEGGPFGWYCCGDPSKRLDLNSREPAKAACWPCCAKAGSGCYDWTCDECTDSALLQESTVSPAPGRLPPAVAKQEPAQYPNLSLPSCDASQKGLGIDMDEVCQRQHGCAQSDCEGGPFGWYCCGDPSKRLDLNSREPAKAACWPCCAKAGSGCYDWTCDECTDSALLQESTVSPAPGLLPSAVAKQEPAQYPNLSLPSCDASQKGQGIDMDEVCQRQHGCAQSDCEGGPFGWYCCGDPSKRLDLNSREPAKAACWPCCAKAGSGCYDWTCDECTDSALLQESTVSPAPGLL